MPEFQFGDFPIQEVYFVLEGEVDIVEVEGVFVGELLKLEGRGEAKLL